LKNYKENVGAVWELPAKYHSQSSPFPLKLGWIGLGQNQEKISVFWMK
jgi:hypothetical protein